MNWPSRKVRDTFLQYFLRHSKYPHHHIPSSSIVPRDDPSLAFVNAGMNQVRLLFCMGWGRISQGWDLSTQAQFKDVILGLGRPSHPRVTNSQKCLRINDLSLVGADTYHHTFFEMLGNWSFANYFKPEACEMAWDLLTNVYKLDPGRMYVTYYAGGNNIPMDIETRDIWKSLGIPEDRILPFGSENFWTMGPIGPCGPSTEIHYDHRGHQTETSEVNGDSGKVVEVWNLVFMQYNRSESGELERLPLSHVVDTGAGLERLTAVLNGKISNYDTDLFLPIFDTVKNLSIAPRYQGSFSSDSIVDQHYRIFADHIRAVTVALSDGILPQTNQKVKKLVRRSLSVTKQQFIPSASHEELTAFLMKSVDAVSESLSPTYPMIDSMKGQINEILKEEVKRCLDLEKQGISDKSGLPQFLLEDFPNLGKIKKDEISRVQNDKCVDGKTAVKWYDSCGVTEEAIEELCNALDLEFKKAEFTNEMSQVKLDFREVVSKNLLSDSRRHFIKKLERELSGLNPSDSGGAFHPTLLDGSKFDVKIQGAYSLNGIPIKGECPTDLNFWVMLTKTPFMPGNPLMKSDVGTIVLDNWTLLKVYDVLSLPSGWILHKVAVSSGGTCSSDSKVNVFIIDNERRFGREISAKAMYGLRRWLTRKFGVVRYDKEFIGDEHLRTEMTILKGDLGNDVIAQLEKDVSEFGEAIVVTKRVSESNGVYQIECKTGVAAEVAKRHGNEVLDCLEKLRSLIKEDYESTRVEIKLLKNSVTTALSDKTLTFPLHVLTSAKEVLHDVDKFVSKNKEIEQTKTMTEELQQETGPFVIKSFASELEFNSLKKITRVVEKKPVLVLVYSSDGHVQGRCVVPSDYIQNGLSAQAWLQTVSEELGSGVVSPPKGQNPELTANLKRIRVEDLSKKIERGIKSATSYVERFSSSDKESSRSA